MKSKTVPILFLLQGFGIIFTAISNLIAGISFKYNATELPFFFNYISIGIGLLFLICCFGMLSQRKFFYKLSLCLSAIVVLYVAFNIFLVLSSDIVVGVLLILFLYLALYAYIIKSLIFKIKFDFEK